MRRIVWPLAVAAVALWLWVGTDAERPPDPEAGATDAAPAIPPRLPAERPVALTALPAGYAVGGQGGGITLLDADGRPGARWVAHGGPVRRILHVEGDLITAGDGSVARWGPDGARRWRLRLPEHEVNDVAVLADGAVIVAADRGSVARLGDGAWHARGTHGRSAFAVAAAPGRVASGGADGTVVIWRPDGALASRWRVTTGWVTALAWTPSGLLVGDSDGRLSRWSVPEGGPPAGPDWRVTLAPEAVVGLAADDDRAVVGTEAGSAFRVALVDGRATAIDLGPRDDPAPLSAVSAGALMTAEQALRRLPP